MLTPEELKTAHAQGWTVADVFDLTTKSLVATPIPLSFTNACRNMSVFQTWMSRRAQSGDALALKVVRFNAFRQ